jgi:hypothetical protein
MTPRLEATLRAKLSDFCVARTAIDAGIAELDAGHGIRVTPRGADERCGPPRPCSRCDQRFFVLRGPEVVVRRVFSSFLTSRTAFIEVLFDGRGERRARGGGAIVLARGLRDRVLVRDLAGMAEDLAVGESQEPRFSRSLSSVKPLTMNSRRRCVAQIRNWVPRRDFTRYPTEMTTSRLKYSTW